MRIVIDAQSLQAAHHYDCVTWKNGASPSAGKRLSSFEALFSSHGWIVGDSRSTQLRITDDLLKDTQVFAIFTRPCLAPFKNNEIYRIVTFVDNGGILLHLSNHPSLGPGKIDLTVEDEKLSRLFGVHFTPELFPADGGSSGETTIATSELHDHKITSSITKGLYFRNSCVIRLDDNCGFAPVVNLPGFEDRKGYFSVCGTYGAGRAVFVADSGFLCNDDTCVPGKGYFRCAHNHRFAENLVTYFSENV